MSRTFRLQLAILALVAIGVAVLVGVMRLVPPHDHAEVVPLTLDTVAVAVGSAPSGIRPERWRARFWQHLVDPPPPEPPAPPPVPPPTITVLAVSQSGGAATAMLQSPDVGIARVAAGELHGRVLVQAIDIAAGAVTVEVNGRQYVLELAQ